MRRNASEPRGFGVANMNLVRHRCLPGRGASDTGSTSAASKVEQISIEAAQPNLDLTTLDGLGGKTVIFGVISIGDPEPDTPAVVAARIRAALEHLPPERLIPAPDCGMNYIPRDLAFAKLNALAEAAAIVRRELQRN
jgi:5-methyltetrahydropteroyltriglutamate--homocysteine methyltransferase